MLRNRAENIVIIKIYLVIIKIRNKAEFERKCGERQKTVIGKMKLKM